MATEPSTDWILRACRREPQAGFAALHARAAQPLLVWAALHVSPQLRRWLPLEDLVQEVWARAYARFDAFDRAAGTFRGWLIGIAHNVLREQLRAMRFRDHGSLDVASDTGPRDPATSIPTRAGRNEAVATMLRVVDDLDQTDRRLVAWRGLESMTYEDIGARLGISAIAAESRWRRVAQRLAAALPTGVGIDLPDR